MTGDDMHEHPKLDALVERSEAKLMSRYAVPVLVSLLGVASVIAWGQISSKLSGIEVKSGIQNDDIAAIKTKVEVLNAKLDAGIVRQVEMNRTNIEDHEKRIQRLERAVRVP